ncbi:MAG: hypothetical protein ACREIQ_04810 [Nitrospiria bacterium]
MSKIVALMKKGYRAMFIIMFSLLTSGEGLAQEVHPKSTEKPISTVTLIPEGSFTGDQAVVWEKLLLVLKDHDLSIASSDKTAGTLTTIPKRYFKILSARFPPVERDYRDTYTINITSGGSSTKIQIQRKFEIHDTHVNNWVDGDPAKEKVGIAPENLLEAVRARLAEATTP